MDQGVFDSAMKLLYNGFSLLPFTILADGKKVPTIVDVQTYRQRQPTEQEVYDWLNDGKTTCIGIVTGVVSGHFVVLDFDVAAIFTAWKPLGRSVVRQNPDARKVIVETTRKGIHVGFRVTPEYGATLKHSILAGWIDKDQPEITLDNGRTKPNVRSGIELLAGGQACICAPSDHGNYTLMKGNYDDVPVLPDDTSMALIALCKSLDKRPKREAVEVRNVAGPYDGPSLIARWNSEQPIGDVLKRYGYTQVTPKDFIRPDGNHPTVQLATGAGGVLRAKALNAFDPLYTPPGEGGHDSFSVFMELEHNGNMAAAISDAKRILGERPDSPVVLAPPAPPAIILPPRRPSPKAG